MFKIKYFFFILLIIKSYGQDYSAIDKAEKLLNLDNKDLKKIDRLLNKAEKKDYGFCLNAKSDALSRISYLKATVFYLKENYSESLKLLDSNEVWVNQKSADSLKIECLIKIYGKKNIQNSILENSNRIMVREQNYLYNKICINLNLLSYKFCFYDQDETLDYKKEITIFEIIKNCNFYHLLLD